MSCAAKLRSLLRNLFRRRSVEEDLSEELQAYLQLLIEQNMQAGMAPGEARRAARIELGGLEQTKEQVREQRTGIQLQLLASDCRFSLRQLRKAPGFTAVVLLTLALGIGANTALFSLIDAVLLKPLPFHDPGRLVSLQCVDLKNPGGGGQISYPVFLDWRAQSHSFKGMSVFNVTRLTYTGGVEPESIQTGVVSANLFPLLGIIPALGRNFLESEDQPGEGNAPVILSYELWQSHFGGDANITGRAITLDNEKYKVIGVMPAGFQFPVANDRTEMWITMVHDLKGKYPIANQRGAAYLDTIARLKPGVEIPQAQADVLSVQQRLNKQYPENRPRGAAIETLIDRITGQMRPVLLILLGAVGFVLLIACANVASLLLARATVREKEFHVRLALGASRGAIVKQLLAESVLLSLAGAVLGIFLAHWTTAALVFLIPDGLARASEIRLDWRVLGFAFAVALLTGVLFGLAPAFQAARANRSRALAGSRASSAGRGGTGLRNALVVSQLAIAFVLLIGAGLLLRSFERLLHVDPGFRPDHVLTFVLDVPEDRYQGKQSIFVDNLLKATRVLPGVESASAIFGLPLSEQDAFTALEIEGRAIPPSERPRVGFRLVSSGYFETMGIPLLQGRAFTEQDEQGGRRLAIVNETLANSMFPNENAIGKFVRPGISFGEGVEPPMREIVGVVGDVRSGSIDQKAVPEIYTPQTPTDFIGETTVVVRTAVDPDSMRSTMSGLVASMDKSLPVLLPRTMEEYVRRSIAPQRFETLLLAAFAGMAFLLTAIGLYGVVSYSVVQRTRELGIRIALGANHGKILLIVLRRGALLTLCGATIGLAVSFFATRVLRSLLFEIEPLDLLTFATVPLVLLVVALLASYLPARRAAQVDPMVALRYE